MDNFATSKQIQEILSQEELSEMKSLYTKILSFDLNLGKNPDLSFVKKFARETTNDRGDVINLQTAAMIIIEFKKFIYLVALRLKVDQDKKYQRTINGKVQYICPFNAPPMLAKVWDLLILYSDNYFKLCDTVLGGFLHKPLFKSQEEECPAYTELLSLLDNQKELICPFWNLWPKYETKEKYFEDRELEEVLISQNQKHEAIHFFITETLKMKESQSLKEGNVITQAKKLVEMYLEKNQSTVPGVKSHKVEVKADFQHEFRRQKLEHKQIEMVCETVNSIVFPKEYQRKLMKKLMLNEEQYNEYVLEYKKYLIMGVCSSQLISPSEQVDQAWHMHQDFTHEYTRACKKIFGTYFKHNPSLGGAEEGEKYQDLYQKTLSFYKALFGQEAPKHIWEPTDERFSPELFQCSMVNLQRIAALIVLEAQQKITYQNTLRRKENLERKLVSDNRTSFITKRREVRRYSKQQFNKMIGEKTNMSSQVFDCLLAYGGPLWVPSAVDEKYYTSDILDQIEDTFYDDYHPSDISLIQSNYKTLGSLECFESLLDLSAGDFEMKENEKMLGLDAIISVDTDYVIGTVKVGNSGCSGACSGSCNSVLQHSESEKDHKHTAEVGCSGACGGSCNGLKQEAGCSGACGGACNGLQATGCSGACSGACNGLKAGGCSGACSGACNGQKIGGCSGACSGACNGLTIKTGGCSGACSGACNGLLKAKGGCSGACSGTCNGLILAIGCSGACSGACNGLRAGGCSGACSGTCNGLRAGGCSGACSGSCNGLRAGGCSGACSGACNGLRAGGCSGACSGSCNGLRAGGCSGACSGSCNGLRIGGGCSGACSGSCNGILANA